MKRFLSILILITMLPLALIGCKKQSGAELVTGKEVGAGDRGTLS